LSKCVFIPLPDKRRLQELLLNHMRRESESSPQLSALDEKLKNAAVIEDGQVPPDLVTMNSVVLLSINGIPETPYTLVYPQDADFRRQKISVLAPIGTAVLGLREGDAVECEVPGGIVCISVRKVIERANAAGD